MKVYFDNVNWSSASGPNTFAHRLATQLSLEGHVVSDPSDYDVAIVFIEKTPNLDMSKPFVHRLDGIWFKPSEYETKNVTIRACYNAASHVVFQSDFDREMVTKWWGERPSSVIRNGIKLEKVDNSNATLHELKGRYDQIFVCSANWHRQKRLRENIELFKYLRATLFPYSCLVVMGHDPDVVVADSNIYYTGALPHETCLEVYSVANWLIHLAWADHSPNVVVEALSQRCAVICSETGGTKELVGTNGIVLKEQHEYKYELFDYENPPPIDVTQVKELKTKIVDPSSVDIRLVAKQYIDVMQELVRK